MGSDATDAGGEDSPHTSARLHLRLLGTTDLHAHILPHNYFTDQRNEAVGLSRTASLIRAARAEVENSLVLDNGDFLQGTPLGDYAAEYRASNGAMPHPMIAAMNAAGIEVATLGNHEFNYGLEFLQDAVADAAFPIVSANVVRKLGSQAEQDETLVPAYAVLERDFVDAAGETHRFKIGVIGFAPPQVMEWDRRHVTGRISMRDIREAAKAHLPALRAAGADIVVALCHSGFGPSNPPYGAENAALGLAEDGGIDALFAGHTHLVFPSSDFDARRGLDLARSTAAGIPAVMAGANGSQLGVIDLWLEKTAQGWQVADSRAGVRAIARINGSSQARGTVPCDARVKTIALGAHQATLAHMRRPIGHLTKAISSCFAMVSPCPCATLVATAQAAYLRDRIKDTPYAALPLLSAAASFKTGGRGGPLNFCEIPQGPLTLRHAADLYPFPNRLCALKITGAQLRDWLERAAGVFRQVVPGQQARPLLDPRLPPYNFDLVVGVTYAIDLTAPARFHPDGTRAKGDHSRIRDLRWNGAPVLEDQSFLLATNEYRAGGGGQFAGAHPENVVFEAEDLNRDVLIDHFKANDPLSPAIVDTWSFAPIGNASAIFDSSLNAATFASDLARVTLTRLGQTASGFVRYEIAL
ncbi:bifunctional 2',3'-cyclic-nucleotide 2'-phosphodiesterase/3'-nucleotidase [Tropicimonas sp. S265A]|uniref:bifunctional 2',3'-cyclic-nucleotide 2'-phosphodiesterase/3'-nucleotidase n=1 Tax=Tropicimonas sp. S265A TaxID=3415134 RepID=UPI003C7A6178